MSNKKLRKSINTALPHEKQIVADENLIGYFKILFEMKSQYDFDLRSKNIKRGLAAAKMKKQDHN
jgi:hypothetical protein